MPPPLISYPPPHHTLILQPTPIPHSAYYLSSLALSSPPPCSMHFHLQTTLHSNPRLIFASLCPYYTRVSQHHQTPTISVHATLPLTCPIHTQPILYSYPALLISLTLIPLHPHLSNVYQLLIMLTPPVSTPYINYYISCVCYIT